MAASALAMDAARDRARWRSLWPPLAGFALAAVALALVGWAYGFDPLSTASWTHWDSFSYTTLSRHGITLHHCGPDEGVVAGRHYELCGTAGWFPLYPALMAVVVALGATAATAGLLVSAVFCVALLALLWNGFLGALLTARNLLALGFAAFVPGVVFHHAVFPMAMAAFFALLAVFFLARDRWWEAGLAAMVTAATYPTGALLAVVAGLWLALVRGDLAMRERIRALAVVGALTAVGLGAVLLAAQLYTGHWDAYFQIQRQFGRTLDNPAANFGYGILLAPWRPGPHGALNWASVQGDLVALLVVGLVADTVRRGRSASRLEWLVAIYTAVFWLTPLFHGGLSWSRQDALLVPLALLVRRLDVRLSAVVVAAFAVVALGTTLAFFQNLLV